MVPNWVTMLNLKQYLICLCLSPVAFTLNYTPNYADLHTNCYVNNAYQGDVRIHAVWSSDWGLEGNCTILDPNLKADYNFKWVKGDTQMASCPWQNGNKSPYCKVNYKPLPSAIGIPMCKVTIGLSDGTTGRCNASITDFIIGTDKLNMNKCPFIGKEEINFAIGTSHNGQGLSCHIFTSQNITVTSVKWHLDKKPYEYGGCNGSKLQNFGHYYKCDFNEDAVGSLECLVDAELWQTTPGQNHYPGQCQSYPFGLPQKTPSETISSVASATTGRKILRENKDSENMGILYWNKDSNDKFTKLVGETVNTWCWIRECRPGYNYTLSWFIKSSKDTKGKKIFPSCNDVKKGVNETYYLVCPAAGTLPMKEEGELVCRATSKGDKDSLASTESETLYTVSNPNIQVTHDSTDDSYTCLVKKFHSYYLRWMLGDNSEVEDCKDCSNTTHSCARLHKKFTTDTNVSCVYGNVVKLIKKHEVIIKMPSTSVPPTPDPSSTEPIPVPSTGEISPVASDVYSIRISTTTLTTKPPIENYQERKFKAQHTISKQSFVKRNKPETNKPSTKKNPSTTARSTTSENFIQTGLNTTTDVWSTEKPLNSDSVPSSGTSEPITSMSNQIESCQETCGTSCIATIVGVVITIVGNTLVFAVYCARRRKCCQKESEEERQISERNEPNKSCGEEAVYSIPHKWMSRPSKKEPTVTYTALDLMPSAHWRGKEDAAYAEIIGVVKPSYEETGRAPLYSNMASEPEYSNAVNYTPETEYAQVLPKSIRKKI